MRNVSDLMILILNFLKTFFDTADQNNAPVCQSIPGVRVEVGRYGRVASIYNLLSDCGSVGLQFGGAQQVIDNMLTVVTTWRELFARHNVEERSIEYICGAILPECFFRREPPSAR